MEADVSPRARTRLTLKLSMGENCWRRVEVPGALNLAGLHRVLQAAFRWFDQQSHYFIGNKMIFGDPKKGRPDWIDEATVPVIGVLGVPGAGLAYNYGPWPVLVLTEAVRLADEITPPSFPDGEGGAPSEDAAWDWSSVLGEDAADETPVVPFSSENSERHFRAMFMPEIAERLEPEVAQLMRRTLERISFHYVLLGIDHEAAPPSNEELALAVAPLQEMLRAIGDGLPVDESHLPAMEQQRRAVLTLGLARVYRGELVRTRLGTGLMGDPQGLWNVMVEKQPREQERAQREAAWLQLVQAAARHEGSRWAGDQFVALGWRNTDGELPTARDLYLLAESTMAVLLSVGPVDDKDARVALRAKLAAAVCVA